MSQTIYITSPINKIRVAIGQTDIRTKTALFYIREQQHFHEADSIGIDQSVYNRKAVQWCEQIVFKLWDGRVYEISRQDFEENCWIYPPGLNKDYKAARPDFVPKLMIPVAKLTKLHEQNKEKRDEVILRAAMI